MDINKSEISRDNRLGGMKMGFFDSLGKKASAAYDATAEKTGKLAKEAKLRMKINENKSDINDIYKEIGKKVYEKHVREENIDIKTELEVECTKIDVLSAEIETCLKSILELKERKQCEKCHSEIDLDDAFCPKCGEKQPEVEVKEAEVVETENTADKQFSFTSFRIGVSYTFGGDIRSKGQRNSNEDIQRRL